MTAAEALEALLPSYVSYYDITRDGAAEPFAAEAAFHSHDEQYFLVKSAKYTEQDMHEYVFFALADTLTLPEAQRFGEAAWEEGMRRVRPGPNHRCTDISLVLLAERVEPDAAAYLKKLRRSKTYKLMLQGWSNYRVIALETSTGSLTHNRLGRDLRKALSNIKI